MSLITNNSVYNIGNVTHVVPDNLIFEKPIPMTNKTYLIELYDCLKYVIEFLDTNNIIYCIESGTLLGCVRHNGIIPWDNDIDIMIFADGYFKLLTLLHKFNNNNLNISLIESVPGYKIFNKYKTYGELFVYDYDIHIQKYRMSYPYIINKPTFKTSDIYYPHQVYASSVLFPVKKMLFEDIYVNVPNNTTEALAITYKNSNMLECKYNANKNSQYEYISKTHYSLLGHVDKLLLNNQKHTQLYDILHGTINYFAEKF